jgi:hypothetical protein
MQQLVKLFFIPLFIILLNMVVFEGFGRAALPADGNPKTIFLHGVRMSQTNRDSDLNKIIKVLESRIKNHHLPNRAKNKLAAMNDEDIRIVKSLCDRLSETGDTASADFALLLVTAVIVLS